MTDTTNTLSLEERRDKLAKAIRKYRGDGYAVTLAEDGLTATLTRRAKLPVWRYILLSLITLGIALIFLAVRAANRKTETVILRVDERGKIITA